MSDRHLRLATGALAIVGAGIAGYLTWVHYAGIEPLCADGGGCERVQSSTYAELAGVPVAVIGLTGSLAVLGALALRGDAGRLTAAFVGFVGFGFSAYLTYAELFEIRAVCQWCAANAVVWTALAVVAAKRVIGTARREPQTEATDEGW